MDKFLIFDLDGTLIDTIKGITKALNVTLKELNLSYNYDEEIVKTFIGRGARILFKLGLKRDFKEEEYNLFLKNYEKYQYISPLFNDVLDTLKILKNKGYSLFIYSNKPEKLLIKLIDNKFKDNQHLFLEIKGEDNSFLKKPDPSYLFDLFSRFNLDPKNGIYIGDSIIDLYTAKNANLKPIILSYGYGDYHKIKEEDSSILLIDKFKDLLEVIK